MADDASLVQMFERLQANFNADKAKDDNALLSFELTGGGAGTYWIKVNKGAMETGHGQLPGEPDLILRADSDDMVKILSGQMNPMQAFMAGKVKAERNMGLAMKLMGWFGL